MSLWESVRGVFTPGHAPPIPQDPEVGTLKPWNTHRSRMEFGGEDNNWEVLPLEPTIPLHSEDLQGVLTEDQPGPESRYQTLDQMGESGQLAGLFPPGGQGCLSDLEGQERGIQGSEEQQPVGVIDNQTSLEEQDQDIQNDAKYFQDLAYSCQTQIEQLIIQREEMNKKYEHQAKLLAQTSQEMSRLEILATQHYTEMLEAQQQKAAVVEEHMLEKATLESKVLQCECELKEEMHQLQLQLTQLESQYTQSLNFPQIPSEQPSESRNLWEEVVGVVPGTVNTK